MSDTQQLKYLQLLSRTFPTIAAASTEIINLQAILNLPKATEHYLADLHGEYNAFQHVLRNASGNIRRKVDEIYGNTLDEKEKRELCSLIYYPEEKLDNIHAQQSDMQRWYHDMISKLITVCKEVSSKYTRSKVRKNLPSDFSYIIQELLHERPDDNNKAAYVAEIIDTIITTERADDFIAAIARVIQRLTIDELHILGDIFDRGPGAHRILDTLGEWHRWDIVWGNHDILWMGAAAGNDACICNVVRNCLRYGNLATLEDGYGISLMPLATFAIETYHDDPCSEFMPRAAGSTDPQLTAKMHKAITLLQFKLEAQLYHAHPDWQMEDRDLLSATNFATAETVINGHAYPLCTNHFPTIDPQEPTRLSPAEETLIAQLHHSFTQSEKLSRHIGLLLRHGCMYAIHNGNLLFHASVPLQPDGTLKAVAISPNDEPCSGRELMHNIGMHIRTAFQNDVPADVRQHAIDYFLYLWQGPNSPLFDKKKMATFERALIEDQSTWKEEKGDYFKLRDNETTILRILDAFGVEGQNRHVVNGHVPVHASSGENPIKANGKLMVIDGGFSRPYHKETGIAGYTLVYHSRGFELVQHEPFTSIEDAVTKGTDIKSTTRIVEMADRRMRVADTDKGKELKQQIAELQQLLKAYRHGSINEH